MPSPTPFFQGRMAGVRSSLRPEDIGGYQTKWGTIYKKSSCLAPMPSQRLLYYRKRLWSPKRDDVFGHCVIKLSRSRHGLFLWTDGNKWAGSHEKIYRIFRNWTQNAGTDSRYHLPGADGDKKIMLFSPLTSTWIVWFRFFLWADQILYLPDEFHRLLLCDKMAGIFEPYHPCMGKRMHPCL